MTRVRTTLMSARFILPAFAFAAAIATGCGATAPDTGASDGGADGSQPVHDGAVDSGNDAECTYPPAHNDPRCPPTYVVIPAYRKPCSPVGLSCKYPGAGDGNGCNGSSAEMFCNSRDAGDDGGDGASGEWLVLQ